MRVAFPKGNVAKVTAIESTLPELPNTVTSEVVDIINKALVERFSVLPKLGNVYIDPDLKDYLVPFSQRSASKTLRTLVRGSKLKFGSDKDTIRFFIWWKDMPKDKTSKKEYEWAGYDSSRVDLDLSAVGFDDNWNHKGHIAFYNLRDNYAVHSGDITSAPNGASEFIDINIPKAIQNGMRYIVMTVHGFTEQDFVDLPECFAGFMLRDKPQSGEIYDPRTVVDRADLTAGNRDSVPLIIDLVDRKVIWCDAAMDARQRWHTVESTRGSIELLGKAFTNIKKPNLYDLFALHAEARGKIVTDKTKADTVFSVNNAFELEKIASEFMANAEALTTA
jgi:stress response protein SCP2